MIFLGCLSFFLLSAGVYVIQETNYSKLIGLESGRLVNTSNSMGLTLDQYGVVDYDTNFKELKKGKIYIFKEENTLVIHRLVMCVTINKEFSLVVEDFDCNNYLVFKGDNNRYGELVHISQVYAEVVRFNYD
jgi:hypothetical protein